MKKKALVVACAVLLLIPTFAAIITYHTQRSNPVTSGAVRAMEVVDIDGKAFTFTRGEKDPDGYGEIDGDTIKFFLNMNNNARKIDAIPSAVLESGAYRVTYASYDMLTEYRYYFSTESGDAYYTDHNGQAYHIRTEDAAAFISSQYALCLYADAAAPVMTVSGTHVIAPETMTWKYRLSNGEYNDAIVELAKDRPTVIVSGGLDLHFTTEPDYLLVQISNGETLIFNDEYSKIKSVDFTENASLNVVITAKWFDDTARNCYGEATYSFIADVRAPAAFYLGETTITQGEFTVITGKNVVDPSAIKFSSEPEIDFTPVFFADGEYVRALIPISYELTYSPSYAFTITYEGKSSTVTLNVEKKNFLAQYYDISAEIIASTRNAATLEKFQNAMAPYFAKCETNRYWTPGQAFLESPSNSNTIRTGFGLYRTLTATGTTYRHKGVDYLVNSSTQVRASCDGVVIYAGTQTLSGRTVIVDHGFGLKTLYAHMSSITVGEGDVVKAGQSLGVVGETGFTNGISLHYGMYVFDTPVCPYDLWEKGVIVLNP